ncbi:MAG: AAA family ATPase, partial [Gammaproteobacteria bacterium]
FGRRLAALHAAAPAAGIASDFGSADLVAAQLRGSLEHLAGVDAADGLPAAVGRMLERQRTRLMARKADGRVRECHGDLHLGNVLLGEDGAVLFDCIEFSDELRIIDTMSDLAFLVMDLDCRGHDDFANALLNEYLDESGDYAGICVLDLYCAYRALVRAKVAELQRRGGGGEELAPRRDAYLEHARAWLGPRGRPGLVITCGVAGSGKSHRAAALAAGSGFVHLRSDRERRRLGPDEGADPQRYSAARTAATYTRLYDLAATILAAGHSVVVDATFLERHWRRRFAALANDARAQFHILHCDAPPAVLTERIEARRREGRDLSEATVGVMQAQLERLEPFADDERGAVLAAGDLGAASALGCPRSPAAMAPMAHRARHGHG